MDWKQGRIQGSDWGDRTPPHVKPKKVTFCTMLLYNSENSIRYLKPFCRPIFCHSSVLKYNLSWSSEHLMRLDSQILLKSPP